MNPSSNSKKMFVIPAQVVFARAKTPGTINWIPAFAGMTKIQKDLRLMAPSVIRPNISSVSSPTTPVNHPEIVNTENSQVVTPVTRPEARPEANPVASTSAPASIVARTLPSEAEQRSLREFVRERETFISTHLQGRDKQEAILMLIPSLVELGDVAKIQQLLQSFTHDLQALPVAQSLQLRQQLVTALQGSPLATSMVSDASAQITRVLREPSHEVTERAQDLMAAIQFLSQTNSSPELQGQAMNQILELRTQLYPEASSATASAETSLAFLQLDHFISQNETLKQRLENDTLASIDFLTARTVVESAVPGHEKGISDLGHEMATATAHTVLSIGSWLRNKLSPSEVAARRTQVTQILDRQRRIVAAHALEAVRSMDHLASPQELRTLALSSNHLSQEGQAQLRTLVRAYAQNSLTRDLFRQEFRGVSNSVYSRLSEQVVNDFEAYLLSGSDVSRREHVTALDTVSADSFFRQTLIGHQLSPSTRASCWTTQNLQRASQALQIFASFGLQNAVRDLGAKVSEQLANRRPTLADARRYRELAQTYSRAGMTTEALSTLDALAALCENSGNRGRGRISAEDQRALTELAQVIPVFRMQARELNAERLDQISSRLDAIVAHHPENSLAVELQTQVNSQRATLRSATLVRVLDSVLNHQVGIWSSEGAASAQDLNAEKDLFIQEISRLTAAESTNRLTVAQAIQTLLGSANGSRFSHLQEFFAHPTQASEFNIEESLNHLMGREDAASASSIGQLTLTFINANSLASLSSGEVNAHLESFAFNLSHSRFNAAQISLSLCSLLRENGASAEHITTLQSEFNQRAQMNGVLFSASEMLPIHGEASLWSNASFLLPFMFGGLSSARIGASLGGRLLCMLAMKAGEATVFVGLETVIGAAQAYRKSIHDPAHHRLAFQNWRNENLGFYNLSKKYLSNLVMFLACHGHSVAFGSRIIKPLRTGAVTLIDRSAFSAFAKGGVLRISEMGLGGSNFVGSTLGGFLTADKVQEAIGLREHEEIADEGTWLAGKALEAFHMDLAGRLTSVGALGRLKHSWEATLQMKEKLPRYGTLFRDLNIDPLSSDGSRVLSILHSIERGSVQAYRQEMHLDIYEALNPEQAGAVLTSRVREIEAVYARAATNALHETSVAERTRLVAEALEYQARGHSLERLLEQSERLEFLSEEERVRLVSRSMNAGIPIHYFESIHSYLRDFSATEAREIFNRVGSALINTSAKLNLTASQLRRLESFVGMLNNIDTLHEHLSSVATLGASHRQNARVATKRELLSMALREKLTANDIRDLAARHQDKQVEVVFERDEVSFVDTAVPSPRGGNYESNFDQRADEGSVHSDVNPIAVTTHSVSSNSEALTSSALQAPSPQGEGKAESPLPSWERVRERGALASQFVKQSLVSAASVLGVFGLASVLAPSTAHAYPTMGRNYAEHVEGVHSLMSMIQAAGHFLTQHNVIANLATLAFVAGGSYLFNKERLKDRPTRSNKKWNERETKINTALATIHTTAVLGIPFFGELSALISGGASSVVAGEYRWFSRLSVLAGSALLATKVTLLGESFSENIHQVLSLGIGLASGAGLTGWIKNRLADTERLYFWQHKKTRQEHMNTRQVSRETGEALKVVRGDEKLAIDPKDTTYSDVSRDAEGNIIHDAQDAHPESFVRMGVLPGESGLLDANLYMHRNLDMPALAATLEGFLSTLPMTDLYNFIKRSAPSLLSKNPNAPELQGIRELLVKKFNIAHDDRFVWEGIQTFNDFFTRALVVPEGGLPLKLGQAYHDGQLDWVARGRDILDKGMRLINKGIATEANPEGLLHLPLRDILGNATAALFEGKHLTALAIYLSPRHYHQTLCPAEGIVEKVEVIDGARQTVDPILRNSNHLENLDGKSGANFQTENHRVVITIKTEKHGRVALVCTSAAMVSTSRLFARVGTKVNVGELIHEYRFGSHNTLVFESEHFALAHDLVPQSEVYVAGTEPRHPDGSLKDTKGITELFVARDQLRQEQEQQRLTAQEIERKHPSLGEPTSSGVQSKIRLVHSSAAIPLALGLGLIAKDAAAHPLQLLAQQSASHSSWLKLGLPAAMAVGLFTYLAHNAFQSYTKYKAERAAFEAGRLKELEEVRRLKQVQADLLNGEVEAHAFIAFPALGWSPSTRPLGNPFEGLQEGHRRALYFDGEKLTYESLEGHVPVLQLWRDKGVLFVEGLQGKVYKMSVVEPGTTVHGAEAHHLVKVENEAGEIVYKQRFQFAIKMGAAEITLSIGPSFGGKNAGTLSIPPSRSSDPSILRSEHPSDYSQGPGRESLNPTRSRVKRNVVWGLTSPLNIPSREVLPTIPPLPEGFIFNKDRDAVVITDIPPPPATRRGATTMLDPHALRYFEEAAAHLDHATVMDPSVSDAAFDATVGVERAADGSIRPIDPRAGITHVQPSAAALRSTLMLLDHRGNRVPVQIDPSKASSPTTNKAAAGLALLAAGVITLYSLPSHAQHVAQQVSAHSTAEVLLWGAVGVLGLASAGMAYWKHKTNREVASIRSMALDPKQRQQYFRGLDVQVTMFAGEAPTQLSPISLNEFNRGERKDLYLVRNENGTVTFSFNSEGGVSFEKLLSLVMNERGEVSIVRHSQTLYANDKVAPQNLLIDRVHGSKIIVRSEEIRRGVSFELNFLLRAQNTDVASRNNTKVGLGSAIGTLALGSSLLYPTTAEAQVPHVVQQRAAEVAQVAQQASEAGGNYFSHHPVLGIVGALCVGLPLVSPLVFFAANRIHNFAYDRISSEKTHASLKNISNLLRKIGWGFRAAPLVPLVVLAIPVGVVALVDYSFGKPFSRLVFRAASRAAFTAASKAQSLSRSFFKATNTAQAGANILHALFERFLTWDLFANKPTSTIYRYLGKTVVAPGLAFLLTGERSVSDQAQIQAVTHDVARLENKFEAHALPNTVEAARLQNQFNETQKVNLANLNRFLAEQKEGFSPDVLTLFQQTQDRVVELSQEGQREAWALSEKRQTLNEPNFQTVANAYEARDQAIRNHAVLKAKGIGPREFEIILLHRKLSDKATRALDENRDLMAAYHAEFKYVVDQMTVYENTLSKETPEGKRAFAELRKDRIKFEQLCIKMGRGEVANETSDAELLIRVRTKFFPSLNEAISSGDFLKAYPEIRCLQENARAEYQACEKEQKRVNLALAEDTLRNVKNDAVRKLEMVKLDQEFQRKRYLQIFEELQKSGRLSRRDQHQFRDVLRAFEKANAEYNDYSQRLIDGDPSIRPYAPNAKLRSSFLKLWDLHRKTVSLLEKHNDTRASTFHLVSFVFKNQMMALQRGAKGMEGLGPITHTAMVLDDPLSKESEGLYSLSRLYQMAGGNWGSNQLAIYNRETHLYVPDGMLSYFYQGMRPESHAVRGLKELLGDKVNLSSAEVAHRGAVVASLHMGQLEFGISFGALHLLALFHNAILAQSGVAAFKKVIGPFLGGLLVKLDNRIVHLLGGGAFVSRLRGALEVYETLHRHLYMGNGMNIYSDGTRLVGQAGAPLEADLNAHPEAVLLPAPLSTGLNTGMPHKVAQGAGKPIITQTYQTGYIEPSMPMPGSMAESLKAALVSARRGQVSKAMGYLRDVYRTLTDIENGIFGETTMFPYMRLGTEDGVVAYGRPVLPEALITADDIRSRAQALIPNFEKLSSKERKKALEWLATQMNVSLIRYEEIRAITMATSDHVVQQDWTRLPSSAEVNGFEARKASVPAPALNGHAINGNGKGKASSLAPRGVASVIAGALLLYARDSHALDLSGVGESLEGVAHTMLGFASQHPVLTILGARWAYNLAKAAFKRADRKPLDIRSESDLPSLPPDLSAWQSVRGSSFFSRTGVENTKELAEAITQGLRECLGENLSVVTGYGSFPWFSKGKIEAIQTRDADKKPDFILVVKDSDQAIESLGRQWGWTSEFIAEMKHHARYEQAKSHGFVFFNTDMLIPGQGPVGFKFSMVSEEAFFGQSEGRPHLEYSQIRLKDLNIQSALMFAQDRNRVINHINSIRSQVLRESLSGLLARRNFSGADLGEGFFNASYRRHEGYRFWEYGKGVDLFKARREVIAPWFAEQVKALVAEYNLKHEGEITAENVYDVQFSAPEKVNVLIDTVPQVIAKNVLGFLTYIKHGLPANKNSRAYYVQDPRQYSGRKARSKYTEGITPFWIPVLRSKDYPAFMAFIFSRPMLQEIPILGIALRKVATDTWHYPVYFPDLATHLNNLLSKQKISRDSYDALSREIGNSPVLTKLENEELLHPLLRHLQNRESAEATGVRALFEEILTLPLLNPSVRNFIQESLNEEKLLQSQRHYVERKSLIRENASLATLVGAEFLLYQQTHFSSLTSIAYGIALVAGGMLGSMYFSSVRKYGTSQIRHLGDKDGVVQKHNVFGEFKSSRVEDGHGGYLNIYRPLINRPRAEKNRRAILVPGHAEGVYCFGELPKRLAEEGYDAMVIPWAGYENREKASHTFVEASGSSANYLHEYWKNSMRHAITQVLREVPEGETVDLVMHSMAGAFFPSLIKKLPADLRNKIGRVVLSAPALTQRAVEGKPIVRHVLLPALSALGARRKAESMVFPEELDFLNGHRADRRTMVSTEACVRLCENGLRDLGLLTAEQLPPVLHLYGSGDGAVTSKSVDVLRTAYERAAKAEDWMHFDPQTLEHNPHYPFAAPNREQVVSDIVAYLRDGRVPTSEPVTKSGGNPPPAAGVSGAALLTLGAMSTFLTGFTNTESLAIKALVVGIGVSIVGKEVCDRYFWPRLRESFVNKAQARGIDVSSLDVSGQALAPLSEILRQARIDFKANPKILVPNALTASAIVSALGACAASIAHRPLLTVLGLGLAPFLDGIDGAVARKIGASSRTGELADDFADNINNGAIVGTLAAAHLANLGQPVLGVMVAAAFTVAIRLRLSVFRLISDNPSLKPHVDPLGNPHYKPTVGQNGKEISTGFLGVASPVAAMSVLGLYSSVQNSPNLFFGGCILTAASLVDWAARGKIGKGLSAKRAAAYSIPGMILSAIHLATDTPMSLLPGTVDFLSGGVASFTTAYIADPYLRALFRKIPKPQATGEGLPSLSNRGGKHPFGNIGE